MDTGSFFSLLKQNYQVDQNGSAKRNEDKPERRKTVSVSPLNHLKAQKSQNMSSRNLIN